MQALDPVYPAGDLDLTALLEPRSVVIIGASDSGDKPGARLTRLFARSSFPGPVFGVNPRRLEVPGVSWVPSLEQLEGSVDLGCVAVSAAAAAEAVETLAEMGVPAAIVYSSGFGEAGAQGAQLEQRLVAVSGRTGMAICGPNTAGVISMTKQFVGSFTHAVAHGLPDRGNLMVVTQSGAVGGILITRLRERGVGISHWVSVGNGAVLDIPEYLRYAASDPSTSCIALFIEGLRDGSAFRDAVRKCRQQGKRVLAFKAGVTAAGALAALSHTGKLSGSDRVYDGVLRQEGVWRARSLSQLLDHAMANSWLGPRPGRRGAVLSVSGAGCTILADELSEAGLELARFALSTQERLGALLPSYSQRGNPVDLTGAALENLEILGGVIRAVQQDAGVDFIVVSFATNVQEAIAEAVLEAWDRSKPLLAVLPVGHDFAAPMRRVFDAARLPSYSDFPEVAAAVASLAEVAR